MRCKACNQAAAWLRRSVALVLLASCSLLACGDDDDGDRADAAVGRDAGATRDAEVVSTPIAVTAGQAVAGVCLLKLSTPASQFAHCAGFDHYEACARRQCDLELCLDQCTQYLNCLHASPEVCDDECVPEDACAVCMSTVAQCALSGTCIETFGCAPRIKDGYCDQLRECCAAQDDQLRGECMVLAEATAALQGERQCLTLLHTVPTLNDGAGLECPIHDAGPPQR